MNPIPPIDLADLRVLVALADFRHFAKAADACNLSQPALSARIRKMEHALGTPLVERSRRFEGFTTAGERVLARARQLMNDVDGLVQDAKSGERLGGLLRIGVIPTATPLAGVLASSISAIHPNIRLRASSLSSRAIDQGLKEFALDAGITYLNNEPIPDVKALPLARERYCLVGAPALLGEDTTPAEWSDLANVPLALMTPDMQNRRILNRAFSDAGIEPNVDFEANSFLAIVSRASAGDVAAILPRAMADMVCIGGLARRDLADLAVQPVIGLIAARREPLLPLVSALWSRAAANVAESGLASDNAT
ncbi:LysR family transcriptional regulator [Rhizobiales bacterium]|uniref:LysR family transcriptional regulator n=1 Tax=Hongsoonwoonella zoysiae TaxID=2821844 RepID=UPI0015617DBA|nr:LysR family transcriptional regulator [Hongsoonwoonella zoysiae]NRG19476.1 LysR family transcriptional regulator [Hongsoonwoonella zoysiae]